IYGKEDFTTHTQKTVLRPSGRCDYRLSSFSYAYAAHLFGFGSCGSPPANIPGSNRFLLVISFYGYNGSKYHTIPWPRMNVTLRQYVTIRAWNNDTQSHGFAITHYFEQGEYIRSRDSYDLTFKACQ